MSKSERLTKIVAFTQSAATCPWPSPALGLELRPCWKHDDPISLLRTLLVMTFQSNSLDGFLFDLYPTCFGSSSAANAIGNLLPGLTALWTRKPVVAYMHNTLKTQAPQLLGYRPGKLSALFVNLTTVMTGLTCVLVFPLVSQASQVERDLRVPTTSVLLPYAEGVTLVLVEDSAHGRTQPSNPWRSTSDDCLRILALGVWGPQKDLGLLSSTFQALESRRANFEMILSGAVHPSFPDTRDRLRETVGRLPSDKVSLKLDPSDAEIRELSLSADCLLLPYKTTGGNSGTLAVAALFGIPVVSVRLPQLEESARVLGNTIVFTAPNGDALATAVMSLRARGRASSDARLSAARERLGQLISASSRLIDLMLEDYTTRAGSR